MNYSYPMPTDANVNAAHNTPQEPVPVVISQTEAVPGVVPQVNGNMPAVYAAPVSQPMYDSNGVAVNMSQAPYVVVQPQPRITSLDDEGKCFKMHRWGILISAILDIFFGYSFGILILVFLVCGFAFVCTYQQSLLIVYLVHRCLSTGILTLYALDSSLTDYGYLVLVINVIMTAYVIYVMVLSRPVYSKYSAEQLSHYN